ILSAILMIMGEEREFSFLGFHGTAESCAISISGTQEFTYGTPRKDHWLGKGAYFFKDDELQAEYWATNKVNNHENFKGQKPYVIEVYINVKDKNFLNLDTRGGLEQLDDYLDVLKKEGMLISQSEKNTPDNIRCYLLSLLPDSIWVIQRTFYVQSRYDNKRMFKEMELHLHGTQVCVRNNEAICPGSIKVKEVDLRVRKPVRKSPRLF
ncbi:hypothetical protein, partial [Schinkia azotoformans]